jgi:hypothetical protein
MTINHHHHQIRRRAGAGVHNTEMEGDIAGIDTELC